MPAGCMSIFESVFATIKEKDTGEVSGGGAYCRSYQK